MRLVGLMVGSALRADALAGRTMWVWGFSPLSQWSPGCAHASWAFSCCLASVFEALVAASFVVRRQPRRTVTGWIPRLTAYANSFIVPLFVLASTAWRPLWVAPSPTPEM